MIIPVNGDNVLVANEIIRERCGFFYYFTDIMNELLDGKKLEESEFYDTNRIYKDVLRGNNLDAVMKYIGSFHDRIPEEVRHNFVRSLASIASGFHMRPIIRELEIATDEDNFLEIMFLVSVFMETMKNSSERIPNFAQ